MPTRKNGKKTWQAAARLIVTLVLTVLGVLFFIRTRNQFVAGYHAVTEASLPWALFCALCATFVVIAQAEVLRYCYRSLRHNVSAASCVKLYLKRFFVSPFIPGGFSVAQYTMSRDLDHYNIPPAENAFVSTCYVLSAIGSYTVILVPFLLYGLRDTTLRSSEFFIFLLTLPPGTIALMLIAFVFRKELGRRINAWIAPHISHVEIAELAKAILAKTAVDLLGITTLWAALRSIEVNVAFTTAILGYLITILILTASPLFQGIVVIEGTLVFVLHSLGVSGDEAFGGAIVFRFFQLWLPLVAGLIVYLSPFVLRWLKTGHAKFIEG